jgi:NDP-sugar pyrophosphorylase family protein
MRTHAHKVPDHAIILAFDLGSRLHELAAQKRSALVCEQGATGLQWALSALSGAGVKTATIVVGYGKDLIKSACGGRFGGLELRYIEASVIRRTGSAYGLWLAREALLSGDVLLLDGDIVFEAAVLDRLVRSRGIDVAAVVPFNETMTGSAVTISRRGTIDQVLVHQAASDLARGEPLFKIMNLFRFTGDTLQRHLVPALDEVVGSGAMTARVEQVLSYLIGECGLQLFAADCGDLKWLEINNEEVLPITRTTLCPDPSEPITLRSVETAEAPRWQ